MFNINLVRISMLKNSMIMLLNEKNEKIDVIEYQKLINKLMHLKQMTRMNLIFLLKKLN